MDIETEKVIELVFPDGLPESWKENPDFYQYLTKLGGFDIDQLNKEPDHLTDEKNYVLKQTQKLAFSNYKTFIRTAESSREIFQQFNETERRLDGLVKNLPVFVSKCQSFCDASKDINTHRRLNSLTLTRNAELLEILEMPQLMESCLRSNQYNEALELSQYARQLGIKHGDIPIIASIVSEIENSWSGMVGQVVSSLRGDLPLPRCLQLVGLLRSMDAFTEPELRIKFLQARDSWFQGLLSAIPKEDPNLHLTKTIELSRIHLFNIITQYRAMFSDDDHLTTSRDVTINESAIFYHWLEEKISQFLTTLEHDLPGVTSIDSILGQCTYFGLSFGRVGADFTGRMSDIFVRVIGEKFETGILRTTRKFEKDMETFTLINKVQRTDVKVETSTKSENPPEQLVEFYPLAEYCNGLIAAFNELRVCAPVALSETCMRLLEDSLNNVAKAMLLFYKQEQQVRYFTFEAFAARIVIKIHGAFTAAERENMIKFAECLSKQLVSYVQYCIHAIFPPSQISVYLGISVGQLQKEGITYLDQKFIVEPLALLLPIRTIARESFVPKFAAPGRSSADLSKEISASTDILPTADDTAPETEVAISKMEELTISQRERLSETIAQSSGESVVENAEIEHENKVKTNDSSGIVKNLETINIIQQN